MGTLSQEVFVDGEGLTSSYVSYYTVPDDVVSTIKRATFCNDSTSVVKVSIRIVKSGGTASYANTITKEKGLSPGQTWSCPDVENHTMDAGTNLYLKASVDGFVSARVSGIEVTV